MMGDQLGRVAEGYAADLLLLEGNALEDVSVLWQPEQQLRLIVKGGRVVKDAVQGPLAPAARPPACFSPAEAGLQGYP